MKKTLLTTAGAYETPMVQLLDFAVEQGFAGSVTGDPIEDWKSDGDGLDFN